MKKLLQSAALLLLLVPSLSFAAFDTNLKYGASGPAVTEMQEFLTDQGIYKGPITGNFYTLTLKAVKDFQARESITPVSGFWGMLSRAKAVAKLDLGLATQDEQAETGKIATPVNDTNNAKLLATINELSTKLDQQTQATQQIIKNTAPIIPQEAPKATLRVEVPSEFPYGIATKYRIYVKDESGAPVTKALVTAIDTSGGLQFNENSVTSEINPTTLERISYYDASFTPGKYNGTSINVQVPTYGLSQLIQLNVTNKP